MKIQILGTGCPKCKTLAANAQAAIQELNLDCTIEKITDINEIMSFSVMVTPALVIDGQVKSAGKLLSTNQIKQLLDAAR